MLQLSSRQQDPALIVSSQRLNLITSELQERVAKTRMQSIDSIWQKFPRFVRDLAIQCGKNVRLEMTGNQTELDKTVLEAIKDPLTHLVRNAIGHGIENPETRVSAGKLAEGRVELRAFHENGQVNIELSDDGAGINLARVRQKAVDNHLIAAEKSHLMEEQDILELIFLPGFSTAEAVTTVSGRGVGMDVVRTNIEKVGGSVAIESRLGVGTTVRIRIPLTLAIIPALIVSAGNELYALPQRNVVELLHLDEMEQKRQVDRIQGVAGCRLRGRLLPLVFLNAELQLQQQAVNPGSPEPRGAAGTVIVLEAQGQPFGLVVDEVVETQEIVVKPLGRLLKAVSNFAGATILGDGGVALILDVQGLARHASVVETEDGRTPVGSALAVEESTQQLDALLVFEGLGERVGIPISQVTRLEEFLRSAVETTEGREVLQYRNEILPLFPISELLFDGSRNTRTFAKCEAGSDKISVVVCSQSGSAVGLVVDRIVDIVEHDLGELGSSGRAVIQGRVTQILDLKKIWPSTLLPTFTTAGLEV
jgi:two-component system chemotaxis sensor kinase CheA